MANSAISLNKQGDLWRIDAYDCSGKVSIHLNEEQLEALFGAILNRGYADER